MGKKSQNQIKSEEMTYLADTTVLIDHMRGKKETTNFIDEYQPTISSVTEAELLEGAKNKSDVNTIVKICKNLHPISITPEITDKSLELLRRFRLSHALLFLDGLIAATAILNGITLVTSNTKHFSFINGLKLKSWKEFEKS